MSIRWIAWAALVAAIAPLAHAQGSEPQIALLDVAYIFKNHADYASQKSDLQNAVDLAESEVKRDREKIRASSEQLGKLAVDSPEYRQLEETLTRQQADINVRIQTQRKRFVEQEARILMTVYQEINVETEKFCKQHGIRAVFRFNSEQGPPDTADAVVALINRPVIYHDPGIDITQIILDQINRKSQPANTANRNNSREVPPATPRQPAGGVQRPR